MNYVFGIDPGSGSSSPAAIALYDRIEKEVIWTHAIWPLGYKKRCGNMEPIVRIKMIVTQMEKVWEQTIQNYPTNEIGIAIENFVIQGKGGATLQMFRGAAMCIFPVTQEIIDIPNTTMKRIAGNSGKAGKEDIGEALKLHIPNSEEYIQQLIDLKLWDEIDAIGLAYSAEFK